MGCIESLGMKLDHLRRAFVSINERIFNVVSWASSPKSEARPINLVAQTLLNRTISAATGRNPVKPIDTIRGGQLDKSLMNGRDRRITGIAIRSQFALFETSIYQIVGKDNAKNPANFTLYRVLVK